ncbi:glycosyltransferase family 2 protein [Rhodovulum adriaticum]|uniref:Glycosyltransferase involved in cell wall biosynthesis n=1 Tax=Rhodovulum adriaticum TaxID=35804 RepID=A0A4R2NYC2_RHOAD|nr:glycosyltransferase family 2 protein [Rhodovulum adriaticum]MBK1634171.1 dolichol-phosphate mannosyltransferase [Rhodovulum adriaticum]TCP27279.1 glycosyltransferase involved in cell wall biosynthesis [Rhodovulum adriaticum]
MQTNGTATAAPKQTTETAPAVSVVIPAHDEEANLPPLVNRVREALSDLAAYEIILVDDGSGDRTRAVALELAATMPELRVIAHDQAGGQSAAVHSGVQAARGALIATLDGDLQNPPENLPALLAPLLDPNAPADLGLVAGQRVGRRDTLSKRLASRFANGLRARVLRDATRDTGCGLKAYRRSAYLALPFFNHQHRYLPALFARDGWQVMHVDVTHAPREAGRSKYSNLQRAMVGIVDLAGVWWLIRRRKTARPHEVTGGSGQG